MDCNRVMNSISVKGRHMEYNIPISIDYWRVILALKVPLLVTHAILLRYDRIM